MSKKSIGVELFLIVLLGVSFSLGSCDGKGKTQGTFSVQNATTESKSQEANTTLDLSSISSESKSQEANSTLDLSDYQYIKQAEWDRTVARFLPYTYGTPSKELSYNNSYKRCNILFFSDSHIDFINEKESLENVKDTIDFINKAPFEVNSIIHTGDAISGAGQKKDTKHIIARFFDLMKKSKYPVAFAKGNHDLNDWNNNVNEVFDDSDWDEIIYDYAEQNWGMIRQIKSNGCKSSYGYIDLSEYQIRIIIVDCQDTDKTIANEEGNVLYYGGDASYIANEQLNWLAHTALNFDDKENKGWGVIVAIHQDPSYSTDQVPQYESSIAKFSKICRAFNTQSIYSNNYSYSQDSFYNISITADYTRYSNEINKPHMICWLIGHKHQDKYEKIDGINMIWILNGSATNEYGDARVVREIGTTTQNAFDLMSIDTKERKIRCVRYGAGVNCYGEGGDRFLPDGLSY